MLIQILLSDPAQALIIILAIIVVISIHEYSHALAGYLLGDHTAEHEGRLTLNPLAHLDPWGSLLLVIVGFGWGRPVPFNPYNLRWHKWGAAAVALAGPISNFIMLLVFGLLLLTLAPVFGNQNYLILFLDYLVIYSLVLGVFNLLPIPPLDGSKILLTILPAAWQGFGYWLQRNGFYLLIALLLFLDFVGVNLFGNLVEAILRLFGQ